MTERNWRNFDFLLLAATVVLMVAGVALIYSATISAESTDPLRERSFFRQLTFGASGLLILFLAAVLDYRLLGMGHWLMYALAIGALGWVALMGQSEFGAQSWLNLGGGIQPSELSKILLILFLAKFLADHEEEKHRLRWLLLSALLMVPPIVLIYRQPDLGTALVLAAIWLGMTFVAGVRWQHLAVLAGALAGAVPAIWFTLQDYMQQRILIFAERLLHPSGATSVMDYNTRQALTSIGSGGLLGKGFLHGTQSQLYFLRVRHTDYVFSVLSEELGFVGAFGMLLLFAFLLWRILHIAQIARDSFGQFIACGVATMILFQSIVNMGVNLGLLPVTGLTLPLVSYGGSSLWTTLLGIGLVESVAMRHKVLEFGD
jgi:rod shape determining protein RodA